LVNEKNLLCLKCVNELPQTNFAQHANNPVERIFLGRLPLSFAHSEFFFTKDSLIQHLIHQLKYKNNKEIGFYLGECMGKSLLNSNRCNNIDYLIPLPLFADKEHKRGYNQATILCSGISSVTNISINTKTVFRQRFTETQTKKHRAERWQNVEGSFIIKNKELLNAKHVLLIDDVVTTGATLESCGRTILSETNARLSIATLAFATK